MRRRENLLRYYERELHYIRRQAFTFAAEHPTLAGRLLLEETKSQDPHVERLIEAFALIAARIHQRLEDDFSEVSDSLLDILYPHFLRPVPSMTICQLEIGKDKDVPASGLLVERNTEMETRGSVNGVRCTFRNAFETRVFPLSLDAADIVPVTGAALPREARSALRLRLSTTGNAKLDELDLASLRLFLNDEGSALEGLYELFFRHAVGLQVQWGGAEPRVLGEEAIHAAGFDPDEGLLDYPPESFIGYRLLHEYFAFPDKFLFVDLQQLDRAPRDEDATVLELQVLLRTPANAIDLRVRPEQLQLNCTPAVNLFPHSADPIRVDPTRSEYTVIPDARSPREYEVYAVTSVEGQRAGTDTVLRYEPLYALRHGSRDVQAFWHGRRAETVRKDALGSDVTIRITDDRITDTAVEADVLKVGLLCTNRDLPSRIQVGVPKGDLSIRGVSELSKITCLRKPTQPLDAPIGPGARWRIVSHLALNHLSLADDAAGPENRALEAFREILKIYDYADSASNRQRIAGLVGLSTRPSTRRVPGAGFARGLRVELELDPDQYAGTSTLLFASVLERFLSAYASINSFTEVVAKVWNREETLKRWPPRAGEKQLL